MKISVVVCVLNEEGFIARCLDSLRNQTIPRKDYEIIVVDGNSTDRTVPIAKGLADRVLVGDYKPLGRARQAGLIASSGPIVAFTDGDTVVPSRWLERMLAAFKAKGVVGVSGPLVCLEEGAPLSIRLSMWGWSTGVKVLGMFGIAGLVGPNFALDKKSALSIGGFRSIQIEDTDMAHRLLRVGRIQYASGNPVLTSIRRFKKWGVAKIVLLGLLGNLQVLLGGAPSFKWEKLI